ncbi:MAG: hypothetical protein WC822_00515 [Candidatus Paceibacterota bacterium]|jgi:hypothetical protein
MSRKKSSGVAIDPKDFEGKGLRNKPKTKKKKFEEEKKKKKR